MAHPDEIEKIEKEIEAEVAEAVAFAEQGSWEPVSELTRFTYADKAG